MVLSTKTKTNWHKWKVSWKCEFLCNFLYAKENLPFKLWNYLFINNYYLPRIASSILLNCYQWGSCLLTEEPNSFWLTQPNSIILVEWFLLCLCWCVRNKWLYTACNLFLRSTVGTGISRASTAKYSWKRWMTNAITTFWPSSKGATKSHQLLLERLTPSFSFSSGVGNWRPWERHKQRN